MPVMLYVPCSTGQTCMRAEIQLGQAKGLWAARGAYACLYVPGVKYAKTSVQLRSHVHSRNPTALLRSGVDMSHVTHGRLFNQRSASKP